MASAADLLSSLSLGADSSKPINVEEMEFKYGGGLFRHLERNREQKEGDALDSDDDEEDQVEAKNPLKVMAEKEVPAK